MRRLWPSNLLITFSLGISDDQTPSREVGNNSVHVQSDPHWYLHGLYGNPFLGHCHVTAETLDLPGREWSSYSFITCLLVHCTCYYFVFKLSLEYDSETSVVTTKRVIDIIRINFKLIDYRGTCIGTYLSGDVQYIRILHQHLHFHIALQYLPHHCQQVNSLLK